MVRCELCKDPKHIQRLTELCEKSPSTWYEIMQIAKFCERHPQLSSLSGGAIMPIIREKNSDVQEEAISKAKEMLSPDKPLINRIPDRITAKNTEAILNKIRKEKGLVDEEPEEQKTILDTGLDVTCPICGERYHLFHVNPQGTHTLKNIQDQDHVMAIRVSENEMNTLEKAANELGISRSALVNSMVKKKMGNEKSRKNMIAL